MEQKCFTILDGAMGTMLQAAGLPVGALPEVWNITEPEKVTEIQRRYVDAGSDIIYANTFGANRKKTGKSGYSVPELIGAGIACARKAAEGTETRVALDIGPIGELLEPLGPLGFDEAYDIYREMMVAGENCGADLIVLETMSDLYEVKAALLAARENTSLPVFVTMTFEASGRTFLGVTVPAMALTLSALGADAIGFNCSLGPKELVPMVKELRRWTALPIILKPNAGLPDPATGAYTITPGEFAEELRAAADLGVTIFGGCCGTSPDFIREICNVLSGLTPGERPRPDKKGVCSATCVTEFGALRVIGERINPTGKKRFQQALREGDMAYLQEKALEQQEAGAEILDVNVGLPDIDEKETMIRAVRAIQSVSELPLQIDSSDYAALEAGLRYYNGRPIVNSVNGEREVLDRILPLCKKYGAAVVGLCMDGKGIPETAAKRIEIGERILSAASGYGIDAEDVLPDCLTLTVSAQPEQVEETLSAVSYFHKKGLHTVLGVSNISFGLPAREHITVSFLTMAIAAGLDLPIVNPNQKAIMDAVAAFRVLSRQDEGGEKYIARFAGEAERAPAAPVSPAKQTKKEEKKEESMTLLRAVEKGLKEETARLTEEALKSMDALEVVNNLLIPALDLAGDKYEKGKLFLPQLISAANAAGEGFEIIKKKIAEEGAGSVSRGRIIIATVEGDIHDIGKNIVKVVLENYGYTVIDLGRDVPVQEVADAVVREDVALVGLSALMTTTVKNMERTIRAIRATGHPCKIWVGGAVLTEEYAMEIGADYYAKDAKQSAEIARLVLG